MLNEYDVFRILEEHDFDTSLYWDDPEVGFSMDELLAMAEWTAPANETGDPAKTTEIRNFYYAPDLHTDRLPDWLTPPTHAET